MNNREKFASFGAHRKQQRGVTIVVVTVAMVALIGFAALAIDIGNLYVARNELQNGADAGALAGARCLYNDGDTLPDCLDSGTIGHVNPNANQIAQAAATANNSQRIPVEVNAGDVERGHWSFATRTFTPNNSLAPVALWNVSTAALDANTDFINAVRVTTRREATPVAAFFARIFGHTDFQVTAQAVAWIGFAGTLDPGKADQPIAICKDKILQNGNEYTCNVGRFMPSSDNPFNSETGGWTSFEQGASCPGTSSTTDIRPRICSGGNPNPLVFGQPMSTNNGQIQTVFQDITDCWTAATNNRTELWNLTLPVVECVGNNIAPCSDLVGVVNVNVVWIQNGAPRDSGSLGSPTRTFDCTTDVDHNDQNAPCQMDDWDGRAITDNILRWNSFAAHFNLQVPGGQLATWENGGWRQKTLYFKPDCTYHEPEGTSEGENFGILAEIPRLVN